MARVQVTRDELLLHLKEQLEFLKASAASFDAGFTGEAKRMAATTRVLLHQTANSHSLLAQLGMRQREFLNTALPYNPRNLLSTHGLVGLEFGPAEVSYYAHLDRNPQGTRLTNFKDWWEEIVIADREKRSFTRRSLVLTLSNKDGGAHIDPELDEAYSDLRKRNSIGWLATHSGGMDLPVLGVELYSMRQIAHEVIRTLE